MDALSIRALTARLPQPLPSTLAHDAERVAYYLERSRAASTFRHLECCWTIIRSFCALEGFAPLPLSPLAACVLFTRMADAGYSAQYIRQVASTASVAHRLAGLISPMEDPAPRRLLAAIGRERGYAHPNAKDALFSDQLEVLAPLMLARGLKGEQEWTAIVTMWHTTFRRANVVALDLADVVLLPTFEAPTHVRVTARRSKNDQYGHGHSVLLAAMPEDSLLCPVRWLHHWVGIVRAAGYTSGPLFRHFASPSELTARRISDRTIARTIQKHVPALELDPARYGAQSVRAGFMTQALMSGIDEARLADRTNHRDGDSLRKYYRPGLRDPALSEEIMHEGAALARPASRETPFLLKTPPALPRGCTPSRN